MQLSNHDTPYTQSTQCSVDQLTVSIQGWIKDWLADNLEISPDSIDLNLPLDAYGVESLMVFELIQAMEDWLGCSLKLQVKRLSEHPSITNIAMQVAHNSVKRSPITPMETVPSVTPGTSQAKHPTWGLSPDLSNLLKHIPQTFKTVSAQRDRQVLIENRWVCDFASCNYLGFDLHPHTAQAIPSALEEWGTHPSWTRAVASPNLYEQLESELATLIDAPDVLVFPSITLLHMGVIPLLAGRDSVIFIDAAAHRSLYEACRLARQDGTIVVQYRHDDLDDLAQKLQKYSRKPTKLIAIDGVYSMAGTYPDLSAYAHLAKASDATLYIDDAHGFGILGEHPTLDMPYGHKGNGVVKHLGLNYASDRIIYCAGLSKAFSSYGAFVTCTSQQMKAWLATAWTAVFSGPVPVASLASAIAGLQLNHQEGDQRRQQIYQLTRKLVRGAEAIGFEVDNQHCLPIVSVVIGSVERMHVACQRLWQHGILITPAVFPAVPGDRSVLRFSITAANTEAEVEQALAALEAVWNELFYDQTLAS